LSWTKYKNNEKMNFFNNHVLKPGLGEAQQLCILLTPQPPWYFEMHAAIAGSNHHVDVTINKHNATNFQTIGLKGND
jgi:hypothetical protein